MDLATLLELTDNRFDFKDWLTKNEHKPEHVLIYTEKLDTVYNTSTEGVKSNLFTINELKVIEFVKHFYTTNINFSDEYKKVVTLKAIDLYFDFIKDKQETLRNNSDCETIDLNDSVELATLKWAVENGHIETVKFLFQYGVETQNIVNLAFENNQIEMVKFLIDHVNFNSFEIIKIACEKQESTIVKSIIKQIEYDVTPEIFEATLVALDNKEFEVIPYFLANPTQFKNIESDILCCAAITGDISIVDYALSQKPPFDSISAGLWAKENGEIAAADFLLNT